MRQVERSSVGLVIEIMCESPSRLEDAKKVLLARLKDLLAQSGNPGSSADLGAWLDVWIYEPLPELGGSTPASLMAKTQDLDKLETLLERMRGGLAA